MATAFEAGGHNNKGLTGAMLFQTIGNIIRATSDDDSGAGIGGGYNGKGGDVEITGGYVVASASTGKARAIGHGTGNSSVGKLSLHRGAAVYTGKNEKSADYTPFEDRVTACQSNRYALILPCLHENSICTITEETHRITCLYCTQLSEMPEPHEWNETNDHCVICNYHKALSEYTIQYDPNGGEGEPRQIKIASGAEYKLPSCSFTPPEGKIFDRWLVTIGESASVFKNPEQDITVTDDITVKALWKELHTVTFVAEDGTEGVPPAQTVGNGEKALKPDEPNREGYAFRYWKLQGTEKEYSFNSEVLNDIILEAVWEKLQTELIITARSKTCVYNGESQGPSGAYTNRIDTYVTVEGLKDGDALTGITLSGSRMDAGEYVITPSAAVIRGKTSNYSSIIYCEGTLTITKAPNPAVIVADAAVTKGGNTVNLSKNVKYAAGDVTYAITGEANGCKIDKNTGLFTSGDETGTCVVTVTATGNTNYLAAKKNITVSVEDRGIVPLHVTENDTLYKTEPEDPVYTGPDGSPISIPDGSSVEISYSGNSYGPSKNKPSDAGRYAVTVMIETSDTVYTGTDTFEIIPKEIRVSADDKTKTFHDIDPVFTATLTDIDGKPVDDAEVSYTLSRIPGENVGEYSIAPSGAHRQGNYFVSYITGALTITRASNPAVIDDSAAVTKGGNTVDLSENVKDAAGDVTYAITGEANGCKVDADKGLFTSGDKAGTCIVTVTAMESANCLGTTKNITVTVEDKEIVPIHVISNDAFYGEEPEDPTYTGLDGGPISIPDGSTVRISYSGNNYGPSHNKPTDVGKYIVTVKIETSDKIYTGKAAFTIKRKEVTVKAENEYKIYGEEDPELEAWVSVNDESEGAKKVDYTLSRVPGENAGEYEITPSGAVIQGNYIVSYLPGTLTIGPADADRLGLRASGYEGIYDAQVHTAEASVDLTDGTVIEYSTDDGDTWSTTAPGIRDADEEGVTVLVRATNRNYRKALQEVTLTVNRADSAVITAPQANKLAYNGSKQKLITAGEAKGGKMQYALGTKTEATESYSSSVPEVIDAGTYYVWYKSKGDQNHHDSEAKYVIAKIDTITVTVTFVDGLGNTLKTEKVEGGKSAAAPDTPIRDGYIFVGWDKDFSRVTSDMTVTALWKENAKTENAKTVNGVLLAKLLTKGQSKLVLSWNKINGVQGYDIFFGKSSKKKSKLTGSVKGNKTSKWTFKKLKKNTSYKAYVKAWIMKDEKKVYVAACPTVYEYTSGGTKQYTNAVSITVKKKKITLKAGRTYTVKAKIKKQRKGRKLMPGKQAAPLRYLSTAPKVAKVTKKGKIKALKKGTSYIYVFAHNGVNRKVQVVVR